MIAGLLKRLLAANYAAIQRSPHIEWAIPEAETAQSDRTLYIELLVRGGALPLTSHPRQYGVSSIARYDRLYRAAVTYFETAAHVQDQKAAWLPPAQAFGLLLPALSQNDF